MKMEIRLWGEQQKGVEEVLTVSEHGEDVRSETGTALVFSEGGEVVFKTELSPLDRDELIIALQAMRALNRKDHRHE